MLQTWSFLVGKRFRRQEEKEVRCKCCGECCRLFGNNLRVSVADRRNWERLGRNDLLRRVNRLGWIWVDPETGRLEPLCPFLQQVDPQTAICSIHEVKPEMCRSYPTLAHGRRCLHGTFLGLAAAMAANALIDSLEFLPAWIVETQMVGCLL